MTESRRGGGGFIRIVRVKMTKNQYLMHFFHAIGDSLDEREGRAYVGNLLEHGILTEREAAIAAQAISGASLEKCPAEIRNAVRADIFRRMIMMLLM
jgi:transcriptional regulator CtsR